MTIIFLHIPKTAGTTTRHCMERCLPPTETCFVYSGEVRFNEPEDVLRMDAKQLDDVKFVCGHVDHSFALSLPCTNPRLATIVRNPVSRAISLYRHFMTHYLKRHDLSLASTVEQKIIGQLFNNQTRILSGIEFEPGSCNDRLLGVAQYNLASAYSYLGFTESMELDTRHELTRLGLPDVNPVRLNEASNAAPLPELTWADISAVTNANRFDLALYRFALATRQMQLQHQLERLTPKLVAKLMNRDASKMGKGQFGRIVDSHARGWALSGCDAVPEVILFVRNHAGKVRYQTAKRQRQDLVKSGVHKTGHAGFDLDISTLLEGASPTDNIHAYALSRMQELPNSPIRVADAQ